MRSGRVCAVRWRASPGRPGERQITQNETRHKSNIPLRRFVSCPSFRVDDTRTELLPELVELADDEESGVRLAAFDTIINLMEMMDSGESSELGAFFLKVPCEGFSAI